MTRSLSLALRALSLYMTCTCSPPALTSGGRCGSVRALLARREDQHRDGTRQGAAHSRFLADLDARSVDDRRQESRKGIERKCKSPHRDRAEMTIAFSKIHIMYKTAQNISQNIRKRTATGSTSPHRHISIMPSTCPQGMQGLLTGRCPSLKSTRTFR